MESIKVNLIPNGIPEACHASQYDEGRQIRLDLFDGLTPYAIQAGDTFTLNVRKPDNHVIVETVTGTEGNTYLVIETTEQMTAVMGKNLCEIRVENDGDNIGSLNFIMQVEKDVIANGIPSESVIEDLDALVAGAVGNDFYTKSEVDDLVGGLIDDESTANNKTWSSEKIGEAVDSLENDIVTRDSLLTSYVGETKTNTKDTVSSAWSTEFAFSGVQGDKVTVNVLSVSPTYSRFDIYLIRSDNTYQLVKGSAALNTEYSVIATADFVKIRVQAIFASYPVNNLKMTANYYKGSLVDSNVNVMGESVGFNETHTKVWSGAASIDFQIQGKANTKYFFSVDSMDDENTTGRVIYFMKPDGTYFQAKANYNVGTEYSYTPSADFSSIRFYTTYATAPQNNNITVSFGTQPKGKTLKNANDILNDIDTNYISGICAPCCIGDSLTAGLVVSKVAGLNNFADTRFSWATQLFKKENGTDVDIIAKSGATAKTILEDFPTEISQINNNDCVCIYLGTNQDRDGNNNPYPIGDVTDIVANYSDTPSNTFIGWYSKLVKTVQHYNSEYAFIVCFGLIDRDVYKRTDAIKLICNNISGCIFQPIEKYIDILARLTDNDDGTHYTPIGYAGYTSVFRKALNEAIYNNPTVINKTANVFRT